jgi:hypothetical protein
VSTMQDSMIVQRTMGKLGRRSWGPETQPEEGQRNGVAGPR